jgi:steroid delta-isomerase-like uncharacterized protein
MFDMMGTLRLAALPVALSLASSATAQDALTVVEDYMASWNAHDSTAAAAHFAEDVTYYDASVGTPLVGREAAKTGIIDSFLTAVPDAVWQAEGTALVGDGSVALEWTFSGTNTGPWSDGTPATGKTFSLHGMSMFHVEGGMIAYQADYYDALGFYKQLGLM